MWTIPLTFNLLVASLFLAVTADNEKILVFRLLDRYTSVSGRPVANATDPVDLSVGLSLIRLEGLDQEAQTLSMKVYLKMMWTDDFLKWDPAEYGGVTRVALNRDEVWTPDMELFNAARHSKELTFSGNRVVAMNTGFMISVPFLSLVSSCPCDPDDQQVTCELKLGSWVYSKGLVNVKQDHDYIDTDAYQQNRDWEVLRSTATVIDKKYDCCPDELYSHISFKITLKRRNKKVKQQVQSAAPQQGAMVAPILAAILMAILL